MILFGSRLGEKESAPPCFNSCCSIFRFFYMTSVFLRLMNFECPLGAKIVNTSVTALFFYSLTTIIALTDLHYMQLYKPLNILFYKVEIKATKKGINTYMCVKRS